MARALDVVRLGRCAYQDAWRLQRDAAAAKAHGSDHDALFLVEHPPVITRGRRAEAGHVLLQPTELEARGIEVIDVDRGGDVTYHGPGQLVAYPVIDLKAHREDVGWMLRSLEQAIIDCLATWHIDGFRDPPYTGVWTARGKIAAIGIAVRHWVTYHGMSLNVDPDMTHWQLITPCGIADRPVTTMRSFLGDSPDLWDVADRFVETFAAVFGCEVASLSTHGGSRP